MDRCYIYTCNSKKKNNMDFVSFLYLKIIRWKDFLLLIYFVDPSK